MEDVRLTLAAAYTAKQIEAICLRAGLTLSMKGSLKQLSQNTHWHFKYGKQKGVLELTFLPNSGELILSVHANRKADWQMDIIEALKKNFT